jgi:hypothetical protein
MWTTTFVVSLAMPVKGGVVSFEGDGGWFRVTVGELVSTTKVTGELLPGELPSELGWVATAVYWPLAKAGLACPELQPPPVPLAAAFETGTPSALLPV